MGDDFMLKCFEENIECTELVLHIVLGRNDLKVKKVETQHFIGSLQGRSIILDIYVTDETGKWYNVKIQGADRGAGVKGVRYHGSLTGANVTEPRDKPENLIETRVIFITENDVLGKGKPLYHIGQIIEEAGENFGDEAHILYADGVYQGESPVGILIHGFSCTGAKDIRYRTLAEHIRYFRENEKGVAVIRKATEDMRNKTKLEERKGIACSLLANGELSYEKVAKHTGSTTGEIQKLVTQKRA